MKTPVVSQLLLAALMTMNPSSFAASSDWKPAPVSLTTAWGDKVNPENAWREYPRPQFVRDRWQNLNGLWDYAIAPKTAPRPEKADGRILVPFAVESALSGVGRSVQPDERLWYQRAFTVPEDWAGRRVLLHFGAVDYECTVWVNDGLVGSHRGGFDAFSFDITDFLHKGDNTLVVSVWDPTDTGEQPRGKQLLNPRGIWYTPVTGIWQTVWLEPVPEIHIAELRLTPDIDAGLVHVEALVNDVAVDDTTAIRLTAFDGQRPVDATVVRANRRTSLRIPNPKLWTPESPFLYDLRAELITVANPQEGGGGKDRPPLIPRFGESERQAYSTATATSRALDTVRSYFAMRKSSVGPGPVEGQPVLLLNNEFVFQHGPLDQGWWPDGLHTPPSDEAIVWELEFLKRCGFNMLRKHIKIEPARYYYHADRLGIMIWQDMPAGFRAGLRTSRADEGEPIRRSDSREQHELELRRMIDRLFNHPSIVQWVIHNESWGQYETPALTAWVKAIDPSRVVNATSGWLDQGVGEVFDIHTYHEVPLAPEANAKRAIVIGEYGGVGWPIEGHLWNPDMRNWGYQTYHDAEAYEAAVLRKIEALGPMIRDLGLSAAVYTQTSDVEGEVNGLVTYNRKVEKIAPEKLAEMNRALTEDDR